MCRPASETSNEEGDRYRNVSFRSLHSVCTRSDLCLSSGGGRGGTLSVSSSLLYPLDLFRLLSSVQKREGGLCTWIFFSPTKYIKMLQYNLCQGTKCSNIIYAMADTQATWQILWKLFVFEAAIM